MKKILMIAALIAIAAVLIFVKDPNEQQAQTLGSIYDNVLQKQADNAVNACGGLADTLQSTQAGPRTTAVDEAFKKLILAWKSVEATYVVGDLNMAAIDYPRYIDTFHNGNEDISVQMQKVLNSDSEPKKALYKNSYKTVNALEDILYQNDNLSERQIALAQVITDNICKYLGKIETAYQDSRDSFINEPSKALSLLANALASHTMMTKDWRIGDPAGLTKKYAGKPDASRAEYHKSGLSIPAVLAIFDAQAQLIGEQDFANFKDLVAFYGAEAQLKDSQNLLKQTIDATQKLDSSQPDFTSDHIKPLYQLAGDLQVSYYSNLITALPVMAKILEADGD